jgi:hypothetical protein
MANLSVIVPYRDREDHLRQFVPYVCRFLSQNLLEVNVRIDIVEQGGAAPFNRGKLLNCGVAIAREAVDYVVLHDVDYLPVEADYSYTKNPSRLIWHGLTLREDYQSFFGAVCGMSVCDFVAVNGFSNMFWHWGCEDIDLRLRIQAAGLTIDHRDGVFRSLLHVHNGFTAAGEVRKEVLPNFKRVKRVWADGRGAESRRDGLNSLEYKLIGTTELRYDETMVYMHVVDIGVPVDAGDS